VSAHGAADQNQSMPELVALQRICGLLDRGEIDSAQFLELFTRRMAQDIGCSRAGVRMLIGAHRGAALRSMAMHDVATDANVRVPDMVADDSTPYFDHLIRNGMVMATDCRTHPALQPFMASYIEPMGVQSILDVSFSVNGTLYGCFSCEQIGAQQAWQPHQVKLLRRMASRVSLALMNAITSHLDTTPGGLWEPSTPNRLMTMPMPLDEDIGSAK
jgi:GAF domain-containing protein